MATIANEELYKEIDLVQTCIERMARNSFMIKGWALTIFAGVIALLKEQVFTSPVVVICSVIIPYLCFWYLDAYFLRTEKCYRQLYRWIIENRKAGIDDFQYDLNPCRFKSEAGNILKYLFSSTLFVFFGIPAIMMISIVVLAFCGITI